MKEFVKMKGRFQFSLCYTVIVFFFTIMTAYGVGNEYKGMGFCMILAFFLIFFWFVEFCSQCQKRCEIDLSYKKSRKILIFVLPLLVLLANIILEYVMMRYFHSIMKQFFAVMLIVILLYIGKVHNIMIWYPFSLYCTIYAVPGWVGIGEGFFATVLFSIPVFSVIEYIIMLILNLKQWRVAKSKKAVERMQAEFDEYRNTHLPKSKEEAEKMQTQRDYYYMENPSSEVKKDS